MCGLTIILKFPYLRSVCDTQICALNCNYRIYVDGLYYSQTGFCGCNTNFLKFCKKLIGNFLKSNVKFTFVLTEIYYTNSVWCKLWLIII